jgi:hypothetical protein
VESCRSELMTARGGVYSIFHFRTTRGEVVQADVRGAEFSQMLPRATASRVARGDTNLGDHSERCTFSTAPGSKKTTIMLTATPSFDKGRNRLCAPL